MQLYLFFIISTDLLMFRFLVFLPLEISHNRLRKNTFHVSQCIKTPFNQAHNRKERNELISLSLSWVISSISHLLPAQVVFNEVRTLLIASSQLLRAFQTFDIFRSKVNQQRQRRNIYLQRICTCTHQSTSAHSLQKPVNRWKFINCDIVKNCACSLSS